ncbi:uncharacterized protein LOC117329032 [Pecten maximus]|uniref:uncharacterized protein LOC117329032 n=1 Tax=Pecten maximus TaxID=6579 RepID=UPI001457EF9C|nr:uncharacterized protein LOC117329032 [Pecten maximus]
MSTILAVCKGYSEPKDGYIKLAMMSEPARKEVTQKKGSGGDKWEFTNSVKYSEQDVYEGLVRYRTDIWEPPENGSDFNGSLNFISPENDIYDGCYIIGKTEATKNSKYLGDNQDESVKSNHWPGDEDISHTEGLGTDVGTGKVTSEDDAVLSMKTNEITPVKHPFTKTDVSEDGSEDGAYFLDKENDRDFDIAEAECMWDSQTDGPSSGISMDETILMDPLERLKNVPQTDKERNILLDGRLKTNASSKRSMSLERAAGTLRSPEEKEMSHTVDPRAIVGKGKVTSEEAADLLPISRNDIIPIKNPFIKTDIPEDRLEDDADVLGRDFDADSMCARTDGQSPGISMDETVLVDPVERLKNFPQTDAKRNFLLGDRLETTITSTKSMSPKAFSGNYASAKFQHGEMENILRFRDECFRWLAVMRSQQTDKMISIAGIIQNTTEDYEQSHKNLKNSTVIDQITSSIESGLSLQMTCVIVCIVFELQRIMSGMLWNALLPFSKQTNLRRHSVSTEKSKISNSLKEVAISYYDAGIRPITPTLNTYMVSTLDGRLMPF